MPLPLQPLTGTSELGKRSRCGIQKHWPLKSESDYSLHLDYIQKINYSIQGFNSFIAGKDALTREDVVFAIVLTDWINDGAEKTIPCHRPDIAFLFTYSRQNRDIQDEGLLPCHAVVRQRASARHGPSSGLWA